MSVTEIVQLKYGNVAKSGLSSDNAGVLAIAQAFGYSGEELSSIPAEANMGLSCGNPTAFASLKPGETVVDLGCGGGLDVFLAAKKVGPTGRAIGIDMTPAMLDLARQNAVKGGLENVEFHLAGIDKLPLADQTVDCIISNCVINLAEDKPAVFAEMARVLKPGGRLAISDLALLKPLPAELAENLMAYVGCIAGAIPVQEYESGLKVAGFAEVQVVNTGADLNAYASLENQSGCCSPGMCCEPESSVEDSSVTPASLTVISTESGNSELHRELSDLLRRYNVNDFVASVRVYAIKPA
ncbi:MAG: arsenite methyltransferase [Pirellulales bacterium]|nr:arsenite methyltransferase [Pirellulales bacterium]